MPTSAAPSTRSDAAPATRSVAEAEEGQEEEHSRLPAGLDSGDIVLFNRRCLSMPPAGAALCGLAKFSHNSRWDHVGVVVRAPDGELLFLEADFGGVKLRSLAERVRRSRSNEIAVRRLSLVRTDATRSALFDFAHAMLGRPYEIGAGSVMARVADPVAKIERERLHALLIDKRETVTAIDREVEKAALTKTARRVLAVERARVQKVVDQIERKLISELGVGRGGVIEEAKADLSRVFCSELVAAAYQKLGLLDVYPLANGYNPKDFSSEQMHPPGLHLLKGSRLSEEIMLRDHADSSSTAAAGARHPVSGAVDNVLSLFGSSRGGAQKESVDGGRGGLGGGPGTDRQRQKRGKESGGTRKRRRAGDGPPRVRGVGSGDNPVRESRTLIREVLKRTPIYSKVPDEYKWNHLTKSFVARVVEPGDVIFTQGEYDDRIYVIESGAVDRFITKSADEDPVLVNSLGSRNSFGLTGFSFNCVRSSTIRASERTLLWSVDRPTFERFKDTSSGIQAITSEADQRALRGILADHFLFARLDKLGPLQLNSFFPVKFRAGEAIFSKGDRGDNFYIIKSGEVERHIRHPRPASERGYGQSNCNGDSNGNGNGYAGGWADKDGDDRSSDGESVSLAKTLRCGQSFGELSLMYNAPRSSTIRARTDVECWAISAESFHRLNLGQGTQYLRAIFERFASVTKDGTSYMTASDLLNFADVAAFEDEEARKRLSALLIRLVTSNRERDPMRKVEKNLKRQQADADGNDEGYQEDEDAEPEVLMDFWEFVRFDLVLNHPAAELEFAFHLSDTNNSGFCSLDEMLYLHQEYANIDNESADILSGKDTRLHKVFGRDGSRLLSAKDFKGFSGSILPPTFRDDLRHLTHHMLNMDPGTNSWLRENGDVDELAFIEPDASQSVLGSQFVGSASPSSAKPTDVRSGGGSGVSSWLASALAATMTLGQKQDTDAKGVAIRGSTVSGVPWAHLVSVGVSGTVSRTTVAPFERLKILMQTQTLKSPELRYRGIFAGLRTMVREDATIWRAGFRGNGANVLRIVPNAAIQLAVVDILHRAVAIRARSLQDSSTDKQHQPSNKAVSAVAIGGLAGMTAAVATYPLDFVRGRLSVQNRKFEPYSGTVDGIRKSVGRDGFLSLYRGLSPTLLGVFPYMGLSFSMYEMLRPILPRRNDHSGAPTPGSAIIGGALASAVGQVAAYPLDTVRRRMQVGGFVEQQIGSGSGSSSVSMSGNRKAGGGLVAGGGSMRSAFSDVVRAEGVKGLFRGLAPNLLKVAPASAVSFFCYEQMRQIVSSS